MIEDGIMDLFDIKSPLMGKKIVIWGTGVIATEIIGRIQGEIDFFIDNDKKKWGRFWYGREIKNPETIKGNKNYYIIIAIRGYTNEIEQQIVDYGLEHFQDYEWYYESVPRNTFSNADIIFRQYIEKIKEHEEWKKSCVFIQYLLGFDDFPKDYLQEWNTHLKSEHFLCIIEPGKVLDRYEKERMDVPVCLLPYFLSEHIQSHNAEPDNVDMNIVAYVKNDEILFRAACLLRRKHKTAQPLHEYGCIYYYYCYLMEIIKWLEPRYAIIWNTLGAYHSVAQYACISQGIPVVRWEHGVLPGTYTFDTLGEMGESAPSVYAKEFERLPVTQEEYVEAGAIWTYIRNSGANRKIQWKGNIDEIKNRLTEENPVIFVAGQNDDASGLYPYTERVRKFRSPIFESSTQSAIALGELAAKNQWNLIYKPHPHVLLSEEERHSLPDNIILAEGIGINYLIDIADVVVTIASQTAYMALLHDTPVLMLGYIQLFDKGCAYQAFTAETIETELKAAIRDGFTKEQQVAFQRHIAQLVKYYLYDDYRDRPLRYGKSYPETMDELMDLERKMKEMRGKRE